MRIFDDPSPQGISLSPGSYFEEVCPYCKSDDLEELEECPVCGRYHPGIYHICDECLKDFTKILERLKRNDSDHSNVSDAVWLDAIIDAAETARCNVHF
jgi:predicted amidophosphoribosyltransferase